MKRRQILFILSLVVLILSATLLITGSGILNQPLIAELALPWGTLITWIGLIALPAVLYLGLKKIHSSSSRPDLFIRKALRLLIWLAILWLPVSFLLAGNLSFSYANNSGFQGGQLAMLLFWYYNALLVLGSIALLFFYLILRLFSGKK